MNPNTITLLATPDETHDYVMSLWSDGPIRRSHAEGGLVKKLIDRFARVPRFFYDASDAKSEWTHFSGWWGGILRCDYVNPAIRDLRYLHEIYHAANMPHIRGANLATLEVKNFRNEREASTFTEMAIYLEIPELRPMTFDHPIFVDRFLFPDGNLHKPDRSWLARWREERDMVFQDLLYCRTAAVLASDDEIDSEDPQIVWLRRYSEQGRNWLRIWCDRYALVENAMVELREAISTQGRLAAGQRHIEWLLSKPITDGSDIPFKREAIAFRREFDKLIDTYETAMEKVDQVAVKNSLEA
jgi:hypothetical protein